MEVIWIAVAFISGLLVRYIGLPPLVGYLAAGFLLNYLGHEDTEALKSIAHAGVLLLLFSVGLKLRLKSVVRTEVFAGSLIHIAITMAFFYLLFIPFPELDTKTVIILAIALSFSSTVVAAKVLEERKELRAFHGRIAIGILIMQDIIAVAILSIGGGHTPTPWALSILLLPLIKPIAQRMLVWSGHDELLVLYGLVLALAGGAAFELIGLSSELGALLLGVLLADHNRAAELSRSLWGMKEVFLVGFFLQIGLAGLPGTDALLLALGLVLALPIKTAIYFFLLLLFRLRARSSLLAALSLATYSEFALIIAQMGIQVGWFSTEWLVTMATAVALSFVIAAPLNRIAHNIYERLEPKLNKLQSKRWHHDDEPVRLGNAQILVVGMGRVGSGAYDLLTRREQRCVGLDSDPGQVEKHIKQGRRVLYADAEDPGLWQNLSLENIRAVLLAMPDVEANVAAVKQLRRRKFEGMISATSVYPEHVTETLEAGADFAYNYFDEVGVGFAENVWEKLYPEKKHDHESRAESW